MTSSRFSRLSPGLCRPIMARQYGNLFSRDEKKKGAPTCAGAPQRSWHCRVCARTGVVGAACEDVAPRENLHVVSALGVVGEVETLALHLDGGAQAHDHVDDLVEDRRADAGPH